MLINTLSRTPEGFKDSDDEDPATPTRTEAEHSDAQEGPEGSDGEDPVTPTRTEAAQSDMNPDADSVKWAPDPFTQTDIGSQYES